MPESEAIDYDSIVTFAALAQAYDGLADHFRALPHSDGLRHPGVLDELFTEDGERLIVPTKRNGHNFTLVLEATDNDKPFFVVPNERGEPGGAGGHATAREILRAVLKRAINRMSSELAWHEVREQHDLGPGGIPEEMYEELRSEADDLRDEERERLVDLLALEWP